MLAAQLAGIYIVNYAPPLKVGSRAAVPVIAERWTTIVVLPWLLSRNDGWIDSVLRATILALWVGVTPILSAGCGGGNSAADGRSDGKPDRVDTAGGTDAIDDSPATVDAAAVDASTTDAAMVDASTTDAAVVDASTTDAVDVQPPLDTPKPDGIGDAPADPANDPGNDAGVDLAVADSSPSEVRPPGPALDRLCTTDLVDPLQPEVVLPLTSLAGGTVPFCNGWILVATKTPAELTYRNVVDGRAGGRIALPAPPGHLVVDFDRDSAYVALPSRKSLARVDLKTSAVAEVNVSNTTAGVSLGNDGLVFVTLMPFSNESGLAVIDVMNLTVVFETSSFFSTSTTFDRAGNQLITNSGGLTRHKVDLATRTLMQIERPFGTCAPPNGVVVSSDGKHVLSSCAPGSSSFGTDMHDLNPSALATVLGRFSGINGAAAFSPDSRRVAVMKGAPSVTTATLNIADVAGYNIQSTTIPGFGCTGPLLESIAWSRGGKLVHMMVTCSTGTDGFSSLYAVQAR